MGVLMTAVCTNEKCDFCRDLYVGGGMRDCNIDAFITELTDEGQAELRGDIGSGASSVSIDRKPCVCTQCGNIYASSVVSYKLGKLPKMLTDNCPECGSSQKTFLPTDGSYPLRCPKCGKQVSITRKGFWD